MRDTDTEFKSGLMVENMKGTGETINVKVEENLDMLKVMSIMVRYWS